jgi:hypothetical protein
MLDCDECHKWFHGACVGVIPENVSVPIHELTRLLLTAFLPSGAGEVVLRHLSHPKKGSVEEERRYGSSSLD